jgi:hypothetical protein
MRLWSIHPRYLDSKGLVALWREALLAQKVLREGSAAYANHPQLVRFRNHSNPTRAIADYLTEIWNESRRWGYRFQRNKIGRGGTKERIQITKGQLRHEFNWLLQKLRRRDQVRHRKLCTLRRIESHPLFSVAAGPIADWEKQKPHHSGGERT